MKKIFITLAVLCATFTGGAYGQSCCAKPTGMSALALNMEFKAAHDAPNPFNYAPENGRMMEVTTVGGPDAHVFYIPSPKPTKNVLLVFHEWWGLNDYIKQEAEKFQKELGDVDVYAIDLYDGKVAASPDEASNLMSKLDAKRGSAIIEGVLRKIGKDKKIVTLGWCMGGSWSFTGTLLAGNEAAGCVMYYGFPDDDEKHIKTLKTDILYFRGTQDNFISKESVEKFEKKVKAGHHSFTLYSYDAPHAFANPSNPKYDVKAATEAHALSLAFLKKKLGL